MKHYYQNVTGFFNFEDLYSEMVQNFPSGSHFVEVGGFLGKSAVFMGVEMVNSGKEFKFDVVDKWNFEWELNGKMEHVFTEFNKNIEPLKHLINPIRLSSEDAVKNYVDGTLDFVFIDADHNYESVKNDIQIWLPKVKSGGILAGHDYVETFEGVITAVKEIFNDDFIVRTTSWVHNKK